MNPEPESLDPKCVCQDSASQQTVQGCNFNRKGGASSSIGMHRGQGLGLSVEGPLLAIELTTRHMPIKAQLESMEPPLLVQALHVARCNWSLGWYLR